MKKLLMIATAAFLISGVAFAHDGDKKKDKEKKSCSKDGKCCEKKASTNAKKS